MRRALMSWFVVLCPGGLVAAWPGISWAGLLQPGDIVVANRAAESIVAVDPVTGSQTLISSGGDFTNLTDVAFSQSGQLFVTDQNASTGALGAVFRVDPVTGQQTLVSSGGLFIHPQGLIVASNGEILVANAQGGNIISVDPSTGAQSVFATGGSPTALVEASNGDIFFADLGTPSIVRVDPVTRMETTVSFQGFLSRPFGIALEADGNLLVADTRASGDPNGGIIRISPTTGAQMLLSSDNFFGSGPPCGIVVC